MIFSKFFDLSFEGGKQKKEKQSGYVRGEKN